MRLFHVAPSNASNVPSDSIAPCPAGVGIHGADAPDIVEESVDVAMGAGGGVF